MKAFNTQQDCLHKLINFIHQTVSAAYINNCCNLDNKINMWYNNLQKMACTFTIQEFENTQDQYLNVI